MKKLKHQLHIVIIVSLTLISIITTSCHQDVIEIDVSEFDNQIVIEAIVTDQDIPWKVTISKTANIYNESTIQYVSDANVTISDENGNVVNLYEINAGVYQSDLQQGIPGRTYTLNVISEGRRYTASSKMPLPIELDSISYKQNAPNTGVYELSCYFTDKDGVDEYCRMNLYKNFLLLDREYIIYQDSYTDGEPVEINAIGTNFFFNDHVRVEVLSIDKEIYEYYRAIYNILDEDPDDERFVELTTANPKSNINNNALGYFSAHSVRYYSLVIQ
jgi:hypothetical protein